MNGKQPSFRRPCAFFLVLGESRGVRGSLDQSGSAGSDPRFGDFADFLVFVHFFPIFCMGIRNFAAKTCSDPLATNGVAGFLIRVWVSRFMRVWEIASFDLIV